jgi:Na+-transporting methylmalonyl-CoA/oxaloacetate decarboxylase gamma subunit
VKSPERSAGACVYSEVTAGATGWPGAKEGRVRTVVVRGGWRAWVALVAAGAVLAVVGVAFGALVLVLLAVLTTLVIGDRLLRAVGLRRPAPRRVPWPPAADGAIEGEYRVVERRTAAVTAPRPGDARRGQ